MKNYLICFYILQQCLYESLDDALVELLNKLSPELWENERPSDIRLYNEWSSVIDTDKMTVDEIRGAVIKKLEAENGGYERTIAVLKGDNTDFFLSQAKELADEFLS